MNYEGFTPQMFYTIQYYIIHKGINMHADIKSRKIYKFSIIYGKLKKKKQAI